MTNTNENVNEFSNHMEQKRSVATLPLDWEFLSAVDAEIQGTFQLSVSASCWDRRNMLLGLNLHPGI